MKNNLRSWRVPLLSLLALFCLLNAAGQQALAQDEPTLAKDSVVVWATTDVDSTPGAKPKWAPGVSFTFREPVDKTSVFWVEVGFPGRTRWLELACQTYGPDTLTCPRTPRASYVTFTGMVDFSVHVRNELKGLNATLFKGKFKVAKQPGTKYDVEYYVDEDWRLPIGYLYTDRNRVGAELWFRAGAEATTCHLFYQGKELGEAGWSWREELNIVRPAQCAFGEVRVKDDGGSESRGKHLLSKNPGEYEIKVVGDGRVVRSVKFTVDADGSFDNGIATANNLGSNRVIVPVKVIGDQDGVWNRLAWKTEAFYGNPLTGFTPPQ